MFRVRLSKSVSFGLLAAVLLAAMVCETARAQVQPFSLEQQNYDQLAPADSSAAIAPGTHINMQDWQQYKKFMPVGLWVLWNGSQFWKLPQNAEMEVVANKHIALPKKYQADTEKYSSQVSLVPNDFGGMSPKGYVAG